MVQPAPKPFFEWVITDKCNYTCSYCYQRNYALDGHCSDEVVDAVFNLLPTLSGKWRVKLIGGEPFIHPRFFEMCERIAASNHEMSTTTNLSVPLKKLEELIDSCGANLAQITASLHFSQVKDLDGFIEKAAAFQARKHPDTRFRVTTVVLEDEFERILDVERRLAARGVSLGWQVLRCGGKYVKYSDKVEEQVSKKGLVGMEQIRARKVFGTLCHTGSLFFKIDVNGDVARCYNIQPLYILGNITNGTFSLFDAARPCTSRRCTCTTPAGRNMIRFGQKAGLGTIVKACVQGTPRSFVYTVAKVAKVLRIRFARKPSKQFIQIGGERATD